MVNSTSKAVALFKYIQELAALRYKTVKNVEAHDWCCFVDALPNSDSISFNKELADSSSDDELVLLKVRKPSESEFKSCPLPPKGLEGWLQDGWNKYQKPASFVDSKEDKDNPGVIHNFAEEGREELAKDWLALRDAWASERRIAEDSRALFQRLYEIYTELERDSETHELMVGNGLFEDRKDHSINHPLLVKRVGIRFNANANVIAIVDVETDPSLYTRFLTDLDGIDKAAIAEADDDLAEIPYHPLEEGADFYLRRFTHRLSSESVYYRDLLEHDAGARERFSVTWRPVFFMRKRLDGTVKAIDGIINNIETKQEVPAHIKSILEGGERSLEEFQEPSIDVQLARSCGESQTILLSKEANKEQLEIAERIENNSAVLVQGPPGTGKTHTIANLLGHFLAEGKTVLVTSQTKKALTVLKDKVPASIQNLCVSVLDDSNKDMVRSVDGITDYVATHSSIRLKREISRLTGERNAIINDLRNTRLKIYQIKYKEVESITYNGDSYTPIEIGKFVYDNAEELKGIIPGNVLVKGPLPLNDQELKNLYQSNGELSFEQEKLIAAGLPDLESLITPEDFSTYLNADADLNELMIRLKREIGFPLFTDSERGQIFVTKKNNYKTILLNPTSANELSIVSPYSIGQMPAPWVLKAMVDGKRSSGYRKAWTDLIHKVDEAVSFAEKIRPNQIGKTVVIPSELDNRFLVERLQTGKEKINSKGKLPGAYALMHKDVSATINGVHVNGQPLCSQEDCQTVIDYVTQRENRREIGRYWNELLAGYGGVPFEELGDEPEIRCKELLGDLDSKLDWYKNVYNPSLSLMHNAGFNISLICDALATDDEIGQVKQDIHLVEDVIPLAIRIYNKNNDVVSRRKDLSDSLFQLVGSSTRAFDEVQSLIDALRGNSAEAYENAYRIIEQLEKRAALKKWRDSTLRKLVAIAPDWADAIRDRAGIHGKSVAPDKLPEAWQWKQFEGMIEDIAGEPFRELQQKAVSLSAELRDKTAELAAAKSWCHLMERTEKDISLQQALGGWKQTIKKIGKGTGKRAPKLKRDARAQMAICQTAVPAWIMPMSRALESFDASQNKFDVLIIDEASQSDISAMVVLYLAKKVVIVGDDKQVSPMAIGVDASAIDSLQEMYLKKESIPNAHIYDAKTSLYDIASTTYRPLMLREHFRCVPDIIGYSNRLSYDYKIKPLRDATSSALLPAVVPYRVENGMREGRRKLNRQEAKTTVALMMACMEQEEYADESMGVISMLGDEQAKLIQEEVFKRIPASVIEERQILCGNAANFQGDERDVIFLSMVDSNEGDGPMRLMGEGAGESTKQRYNVAVSRARNQLWIVHSIDYKNDLKNGDIRRDLLEYAADPQAEAVQNQSIEKFADSPFESSVAKKLVALGYHIIQQYPVGAYRIDMVIKSGNNQIALECDGERFHSGEEKIREDMERQTILERTGWTFIRVRGSEYYSDPDGAIERIISELNAYGVFPEDNKEDQTAIGESYELLERVKIRAAELLRQWENEPEEEDPYATKYEGFNPVRQQPKREKAVQKVDFLHIGKIERKPNAEEAEEVQEEKPTKTVPNEERLSVAERLAAVEKEPGEEKAHDIESLFPQDKYQDFRQFCRVNDLITDEDVYKLSVSELLEIPGMTIKMALEILDAIEVQVTEKHEETPREKNGMEPNRQTETTDLKKEETGNSIAPAKPTRQEKQKPSTRDSRGRQQDTPSRSALRNKASKESLFTKLDEYGFSYVDNSASSGIIWVTLTEAQKESKRELLENLLDQRHLKYSYEPRGAMATKGKPAYRIMIRG